MLDLKTFIAKSATELNRVRDSMRRAETNTAPGQYRAIIQKL